MSSYQKKLQTTEQNKKDYSKYTSFKEEEYLPYPNEGFSTSAVHQGSEPDEVHGSIAVPIHLSSTFAHTSPQDPFSRFFYTRYGNPTREAFEKCVAACEKGKYAFASTAGLAANTAIFHILNSGDHVIVCEDIYGGTTGYLNDYSVKKHNIELEQVDTTDIEQVQKALKKNTRILWIETPSNPTLLVSDIEELAKIAHNFNKDIIVVVDNTFMTPYLQNPLLLGADIVTHSVSKYIGGHSDVVMGITITNSEVLYKDMLKASQSFGGNPSPFDCYLALRGNENLGNQGEGPLLQYLLFGSLLQDHRYVKKVYYGGLKGSQGRDIIEKQQRGYGGVLSFELKGGIEHSKKFLQSLKVFTLAVSLGGVESMAQLPALMSHTQVPEEKRLKLGITAGFIRLAVGIESVEDIIQDVDSALELTFKELGEN